MLPTCAHSWMYPNESGRAEHTSHTAILSECHSEVICRATALPIMILCWSKSEKFPSSVEVNVPARSTAEVEASTSSRKVTTVLKDSFQSISGTWTYVCRNRTSRTQSTFRMSVRLGGCSLKRRWIGPAMKSNPGIGLKGGVRLSSG